MKMVAFTLLLLTAAAPQWQAQTGSAVLVGTVLADSMLVPLEGAEVALPALAKRALTAGRGEFRIDGIATGTHEVVVRHIGFSPQVVHIRFSANETIEREILLRRVRTLDTVSVRASAVIPSFEEHRAVGLGTFITRADLAPQEGRKVSDIIAQLRGVRLQFAMGGKASVYSSRRVQSSIRQVRTGELCYAQVYVDQALVYRGGQSGPTGGEPPYDINTMAPSEIEAIEYYAGPASTPHRYSKLNSQCGVLVIHTRRTP